MSAAKPAIFLEQLIADGVRSIGQLRIRSAEGGFTLHHIDDESADVLAISHSAEDALEIARYDDTGAFRPLKTAPNLRHGWQLVLADLTAVARAIDYLYPGRLAAFASYREHELVTTSLRDTLARQTGMYRVAAQATDTQLDELVGHFCRSDGGCLRTILWRRNAAGDPPSSTFAPEKFDPQFNQSSRAATTIPLLCQEACNLLVAEVRRAVKSQG